MALIGPKIANARIRWQDDGSPVSVDYSDIYYSSANGYEESLHVFIEGNQLTERFQSLPSNGHFTIAETGFGSGLNFLTAWETWDRYAPDGASLHYLSVENSPLSKADLSHCHRQWTQLADKASALQSEYPQPVFGVHRCTLSTRSENQRSQANRANSRPVKLTLFYGEALQWFRCVDFLANAWFLDGFSPPKNPTIWSHQIIQKISQHSLPGTTLTTYTVAGHIRRSLSELGFSVNKQPGFGPKRSMTKGVCVQPDIQKLAPSKPASGPVKVLIVGSGLAGAIAARELASRGSQVEVFEASPRIAAGASGNWQGALYVKLAVDLNPHTRYHLASYLFAVKAYSKWLAPEPGAWNITGVLQLAHNEKEQRRQTKFLCQTDYPESIVYPVNKDAAEQLAGVELNGGGLFFPGGGWCQPAKICSILLEHPQIELHTNTAIVAQQIVADGVVLRTQNGQQFHGDCVVYCTGNLPQIERAVPATLDQLPVKLIKGQISQFPVPKHQPFALKTVICADGYAMPVLVSNENQLLVTGATFHPRASDLCSTQEDNAENLRKLGLISPAFQALLKSPSVTGPIIGRASVRAALPDYLPLVGLLQANTYINTGYGSKGLALAPLAGEIIADMISDNPLPLENDLIRRLSPARFLGRVKTGNV